MGKRLEEVYLDTQKIPEGVIIGMLESEIQELQDIKAKLEAQYAELKNAYDSVMSLTEEGRKKVREALYGEYYVDQLKTANNALDKKNKRLQSTVDELTYRLAQYQLKEMQSK